MRFQKIITILICLWSVNCFGADVPVGNNLVPAADAYFESGSTSWVNNQGSIAIIAGGYQGHCLQWSNNGTVEGWVGIGALEAGVKYRLSVYIKSDGQGVNFGAVDDSQMLMAMMTFNDSGRWAIHTIDMTGTGQGCWLYFYSSGSPAAVLMDNVEVFKLDNSEAVQSVNMWGVMSLFFGVMAATAFIYGVKVLA